MSELAQALGYAILGLVALSLLVAAGIGVYVAGWLVLHRGDPPEREQPDGIARFPHRASSPPRVRDHR